jgi:hypothetical protein
VCFGLLIRLANVIMQTQTQHVYHQVIFRENTSTTRGMLNAVKHCVQVLEDGEARLLMRNVLDQKVHVK